MAIFGKIFGTVAGFVSGGPVGALLGAALGHAADQKKLLNPPPGGWEENWKNRLSPDFSSAATYIAVKMAAASRNKDQLFGICLIILSAKLAKCDGAVNRAEINSFKRFFFIPEQQQKQVGLLFDQARQRTDDYEKFAQELARTFANDKSKLENALALLFIVARSDAKKPDQLHPEEEKFLRNVHRIFGLPNAAWDHISRGGIPRNTSPNFDAYVVLGITQHATDEEVRTTWRQLVRKYHPDSMISRGANQAEIDRAAQKVAQINAAWDQIKRDRNL